MLKSPFYLVRFTHRQFTSLINFSRNASLVDRLTRENQLLKYRINALTELAKENERLEQLLSLKNKSAYRVIAARVIARSPENWSQLVVIDKGRNQGIRDKMPVINYLGLVGKVIEAGPWTSKVLLLNDPAMGVSAFMQGSRQEVLVCGTLGANLMMKYLSQDYTPLRGEAVVTSGFSESFPKGILIGTVIAAGKEFSGLSSFALVKPAVNFSSIEEVLVIVE